MHKTRQQILEILKQRKIATVDEIVDDLEVMRGASITAVTVRHHLGRLQNANLIETPQARHRSTPGRPQHIYQLSGQSIAVLPNNYQHLASTMLTQMQTIMSETQVNVVFEGIADAMIADADMVDVNGSLRERLENAVEFLNEHGYEASWETNEQGYLLHTLNCPYHRVAQAHEALCVMDMRIVSQMLGVVPRMMARITDGDNSCSYFVPNENGVEVGY